MISFKPFNYTCMYVLQVMQIKILSIISVDGEILSCLIQCNKGSRDRGEGRGCRDNIEGTGTTKGLAMIRWIECYHENIQ